MRVVNCWVCLRWVLLCADDYVCIWPKPAGVLEFTDVEVVLDPASACSPNHLRRRLCGRRCILDFVTIPVKEFLGQKDHKPVVVLKSALYTESRAMV